MMNLREFSYRLSQPTDAASVAAFRIVFGIAMFAETWRYMGKNWFGTAYLGNDIHFSYPGFSWIHALPHPSADTLGWMMLIASVGIAAGLLYRAAAGLFFLCFSFVFLYEQTQFLNHFYLISLLSFLLIFVPSHRVFSIDSIIGESLYKRNKLNIKIAQFFFPHPLHPCPHPYMQAWGRYLLLFQVSIPYFFGGVAKLLTPDWLQGYPMRFWLAGRSDLPVIGSFADDYWLALFMSWGGMVFDLAIVPLILWKRTRWIGVALMLAFNLMNMQMFRIGIFPWLMIGTIPLFFGPDWPRTLWDLLTLGKTDRADLQKQRHAHADSAAKHAPTLGSLPTKLILAYALIQILLPFRHLFYAGNVQRTGEGGFYAWHMKLTDRRGYVEFRVTDRRTGKTTIVDPRPYLSKEQIPEMATHPDVILQFAWFLRDSFGKGQPEEISVFADAHLSINGRDMERLIDPRTDLAKTPRTFAGHASWILLSHTPLPDDPRVLEEESDSE